MKESLKEQTAELLLAAKQLTSALPPAENRKLKSAVIQKVADILTTIEALQ